MATTGACDSHDPLRHSACLGVVQSIRYGGKDSPCACECHLQDMRTNDPVDVTLAKPHRSFPKGPFRNLTAMIAAVREWRRSVAWETADALLSAARVRHLSEAGRS